MGLCILGAAGGIWLDHGAFDWPGEDQARSATLITFLVLWVSNIKLEIWTLEPLRQLDSDMPASPPDAEAFSSAVKSYLAHLTVHSILIIAVATFNSI